MPEHFATGGLMALCDQIPAEELRQLYIQAGLRQRFDVACSRINHPEAGPNQVVAAVAALEGFSRAVAVKVATTQGEDLESAYTRLKWTGPVALIEEHVLPSLDRTAGEFDADDWALVQEAVEFRNLLVHEATYLHGGTCESLAEAVVRILNEVARLAGVEMRAA